MMASVAIIDQPATEIVPVANAAAAVVLFDQAKFDAFYAKLKADVDAVPVDLTTKKGRDAIASVSAKVRSEKASIDKDRLRLTAEWRNMTAQVNGAWNGIKEQLDALAVEARKPLTEWEAAEEARKTKCDEIINRLARDGMVSIDDTADDVRARGMAAYETVLDPALFGDKLETAQQAKDHAISQLKAALARLTREEAERAELEKLRAEAAERAEAERIAAELAEAERAEAARIEAERVAVEKAKAEAEQRRIAAEQAESARIERAKVEAAELAQRQAQEAAKAEQDKRDAEHARQLAEAQAERDRIAAQEKARIAEQEAAAAEQAKRDANQKHRTAVMRAAKEAIMTCGADEETAKKIVLLIRAGDVPHVTLRF
ncbi:hypothetical protein [Sphingobium sp.]|uniref:hypothetical protein n=1 Tax=Sphingobium sp. TaxID=1912891 RepID=UPI00257AE5C0|nr:hypothetical protein [Sphingobium sp.]